MATIEAAEALEHLRQIKSPDFTIRNAESKDFRDLIAYAAAFGGGREAKATSEGEALIASIGDLRIAAQVRWTLNENRSLKRRLDLLHAAFRKLDPISRLPPEGLNGGEPSTLLSPPVGSAPVFTEMEIAAVRQFLANVPELDCSIDEGTGALFYRNGFGDGRTRVPPSTSKDHVRRAKLMPPFNSEHADRYPASIGCDEAGRGALCGPVVVAAVWFDPRAIQAELLGQLDDSKKLSAPRREQLAALIRTSARVAVAASAANTIDRCGIRPMTLDAMRRAVLRLGIRAPALFDGIDVPPGLPLPCEAVVKGDGKIPQIAAASIIAKTCRDALMARLAVRYPGYCWEKNAGYGTKEHLAAIAERGSTRHHRWSFSPVAQHELTLERLRQDSRPCFPLNAGSA